MNTSRWRVAETVDNEKTGLQLHFHGSSELSPAAEVKSETIGEKRALDFCLLQSLHLYLISTFDVSN